MLFDSLANALLMCGFGMVAALLLDMLALRIAPLRKFWVAPGAMIVSLCESLERRLNKAHRGDATVRGRGVVVTLVLVAIAAFVGWLLQQLVYALGSVGAIVQVIIAAWCFSAVGLLHAARRMRSQASQARAEQLQALVQPHVAKDALLNDRYSMMRALVQALAQSVRDRAMAPIIGALLFGLPGLLAVRLAALLARIWAHPVKGEDFSASVRSLWMVVGAPASVLAATMLATSALVTPGAKALPAWRQWWLHAAARDGAVAVLGGATGTQLAGPRIGAPQEKWLGEGTPKPNMHHFRIGAWLHQGARWQIALLLVCAALTLI